MKLRSLVAILATALVFTSAAAQQKELTIGSFMSPGVTVRQHFQNIRMLQHLIFHQNHSLRFNIITIPCSVFFVKNDK